MVGVVLNIRCLTLEPLGLHCLQKYVLCVQILPKHFSKCQKDKKQSKYLTRTGIWGDTVNEPTEYLFILPAYHLMHFLWFERVCKPFTGSVYYFLIWPVWVDIDGVARFLSSGP